MKKAFTIALALMVFFCAGCAAAPSATPAPASPQISELPSSTPEPTPSAAPYPSPEPTPPPTELRETEDMGQEYLDSIVFYGDSNTNGLRLLELLPGGYGTNQIWTPMSGTLTLCYWDVNYIVYPETWTEMPVTEAMAKKQPEYLIINLGENGISFMDEDYFTSEYTEMVEALKEACPDTKIMLSSLYPVAASYPNQDDINNEKITAANSWIYGIAEATGTRYIDCAEAVRGEDGALPETLHDGDGYHLNADAFALVLSYIRTHGYQ
ncbi:MAG: SGNH/GDSL hydrolase family protein [Clostridia bacterium]|nr:SGNH/GDSL hydrolase family protein [Clostridia bacterium]